jgi:hypothetical protein
LCSFSPPHCKPPQTYGLLYGRLATSYTAGTLGAIIFEFIGKKILDKIKKLTIININYQGDKTWKK